jgi:peptidoglycan/xylan/chitin deacetylase (PgdA/CDA1 family)
VTAGALVIAAAPFASALAGLTYATVAPACRFWGPLISRAGAGAASESKRIALTFDDGPTAGTTERVLDALGDAGGAKATFFVVGTNAEREPGLLRRIHDEGHLIGNHTYHHSHYGMMRTLPWWKRQIRQTDDLIESIIGVRPALFRPPMGVKTWHTTRAARELGHTIVTWSRRAMDGFPTRSDKIVGRFGDAADGEILLLHDGIEPHSPHRNREATIGAVRPLIESLRGRGLEPVRLDELLELAGYQSRAATVT